MVYEQTRRRKVTNRRHWPLSKGSVHQIEVIESNPNLFKECDLYLMSGWSALPLFSFGAAINSQFHGFTIDETVGCRRKISNSFNRGF